MNRFPRLAMVLASLLMPWSAVRRLARVKIAALDELIARKKEHAFRLLSKLNAELDEIERDFNARTGGHS